jgi:hypothetical protein
MKRKVMSRRMVISNLFATSIPLHQNINTFLSSPMLDKPDIPSRFFSIKRYGTHANAIINGEEVTRAGDLFIVDDHDGSLIFREKKSVGSTQIAHIITPASLTAEDAAAKVFVNQPIIGASKRSLQDKLSENISVKDFGAVGDNATDDSDAFNRAIFAARSTGKDLYIPAATYLISSPINILFDKGSRGIRIFGSNSGSYYAENGSTTINYTNGKDYFINIVGADTGDGGPAFVRLEGLRIIGNDNPPGAILIRRSWHVDLRDCSFINFGNLHGGAVTLDADGPTGFSGIVDIERCTFANCGCNVKFTGSTGGQINVVRLVGCVGVGQHNAVSSDWRGAVPFTSNITIRDCLWEGSRGEVIRSDAVAGNWIIHGGYIEDSNPHTPIKFLGSANYGIIIQGVFFRKSSLANGQSLASIVRGINCNFTNNSSGFGDSEKAFSADFVDCIRSFASPADGVAITPYPVRMNNETVKGGGVSSEWSRRMEKGSGFFCGISSGDGWPGGSVCDFQDEIRLDNGLVRVVGNITVTTKSQIGENILIGLLPFKNGSCRRCFPVYTKNVAGDNPFYGVVMPNQRFATVYDRNGVPLNYQKSISEGSYFEFVLDYTSSG